jgi:hypothetical protein
MARLGTGRRAATGAATPDWQVYYLYDRWRPTFYVSATSDTFFFAGPATEAGTPTPGIRRERQIESGIVLPIRHVRLQHAMRLSFVRAQADDSTADGEFSRSRTPIARPGKP